MASKIWKICMAVALAFAVLVIPTSASVISATQQKLSYGQSFIVNYNNISIKLDGIDANVILGQDIQFYDENGRKVAGRVILERQSDENKGETVSSDSNGWFDTRLLNNTGNYTATCPDCQSVQPTTIHVGTTKIILELKKGTSTISSVSQGSHFTIKLTTSLDANDGVSLKVKNPDGDTVKKNPADGTVFDGVNVSYLQNLDINTTGWEIGTYTFRVSTSETKARGLVLKSEEKTLEIVKPSIEIKAEETTVGVGEPVKLTVTGVPGHNITVTGGQYALFPGGVNNNPSNDTIDTFTHSIGSGGKRTYTVIFNKTGSHKVKVTDTDSGKEDTVDISVVKRKVTFYMPDTCVIGDDLVINGTATAGDTVDIAIDDVIVMTDIVIDDNGDFKEDLPTPDTRGTGVEGDIEIEAFIDKNFVVGQHVGDFSDDGFIIVSMVKGGLTAELSSGFAALGDSFIVNGTAPGSDAVDIITIAPRGGGGKGIDPSNSALNGLPSGITIETVSTSGDDFSFSAEIDIQKNADSGIYLVFVLTPGKDGEYGMLGTDNLFEGIKREYAGGDLKNLAAKTQEQIRDIIADATIGAAGSDDFVRMLELKIGERMVRLDPVADVVAGSDLIITGISNREGRSIKVSVRGSSDLGTMTVVVTKGVFSAKFNTTGALPGKYTVVVDDRDDHTDTASVNITAGESSTAKTPVPTATVEATPAPTPAPAQTTTPVPTQTPAQTSNMPGFETVFAIMGMMIAIAFAVFVAKKRGGER